MILLSWVEQEKRPKLMKELNKLLQLLRLLHLNMTRRNFKRDLVDSLEVLQSLKLEEHQKSKLVSLKTELKMLSAQLELHQMRVLYPVVDQLFSTLLED